MSWQFARFPEGAWDEFGASMQSYNTGKSDKAKLLEDFQKNWDNLKK